MRKQTFSCRKGRLIWHELLLLSAKPASCNRCRKRPCLAWPTIDRAGERRVDRYRVRHWPVFASIKAPGYWLTMEGEMIARRFPGAEPGTYQFKADIRMAGRWQLSLGVRVPGERAIVERKLIMKADNRVARNSFVLLFGL